MYKRIQCQGKQHKYGAKMTKIEEYIYIEYYEERKNLKDGSELAKKNKLKKKNSKPVQVSHATSSPGSGCGFCRLYFRQVNKVSKQLILWFRSLHWCTIRGSGNLI